MIVDHYNQKALYGVSNRKGEARVSKNQSKSKSVWNSKKILFLAFVGLLAINFSLMGVSLARYVSEVNYESGNLGAGIYEFQINGSGVINASTTIGASGVIGPDEPDGETPDLPPGVSEAAANPMSVTVENAGEYQADGIVTLEVEGILPLDYAMYGNGNKLDAVSLVDGVYTFNFSLDKGEKVVFDLYVIWQGDEYDERLNGLAEDVYFKAIFEQAGD